MGHRPAATALIEQQNVIALRIEKLPVGRRTAAARAAVQEYRRFPSGLPQSSQYTLMAVFGIPRSLGNRVEFRGTRQLSLY